MLKKTLGLFLCLVFSGAPPCPAPAKRSSDVFYTHLAPMLAASGKRFPAGDWRSEILRLAESRSVQTVIFDLGDTLILEKEEGITVRLFRQLVEKKFGVSVSEDEIKLRFAFASFPGVPIADEHIPLWEGKEPIEPYLEEANLYFAKLSGRPGVRITPDEFWETFLLQPWRPNPELYKFIEDLKRAGITHFAVFSDMMIVPSHIKKRLLENIARWFPDTFRDEMILFSSELGALKGGRDENFFSIFLSGQPYYSALLHIPEAPVRSIAFLDNSKAKALRSVDYGFAGFQYYPLPWEVKDSHPGPDVSNLPVLRAA